MTTINLNTDSLFKDILAAFDEAKSETPNQSLVDLGRHQTLVLKEMVNGLLPHLMGEQGKEVKKLEEQNKIMLDAIKEAVSYPDDYYWRIINELLEKTLQEVEGE
jgi:hypothetical protein